MRKLLPFIFSALFTLIIFLIHLFFGVTTMINGGGIGISNESITEIVNLHRAHPVFERRKMTTFTIDLLSEFLNLEIGLSFVIVNFFFLFLSGITVYLFSKEISKSVKFSLLSLAAYFVCFSNLFAFFPPVYTYDEPLQFCFVFLSFILYLKERIIGFIIAFSLAIIIRETTMILVPALFFYFIYDFKIAFKQNLIAPDFRKKVLILIIPLVVYAIYFYNTIQNPENVTSSKDYFLLRFSRMGYNFQNADFIIETLGAFLIIFLIPVYFLYQGIKGSGSFKFKFQKYIKAFFLTWIINTIIVLLSARVRELRLLVIPMFFLWPILGVILSKELRILLVKQNYFDVFMKAKYMIVLLLSTLLNVVVSFVIYHTTIGPKIGVFNAYLFLSIELILIHSIMKFNKKAILTSIPHPIEFQN